MERLAPLLRISLGLVLLTASLLVLVDLLGLLPRPANVELEGRVRICETLAAQTMPAAERSDFAAIRAALLMAVRRDPEILAAGLRAANGRLLVEAGDHRALWSPDSEERSTATHVMIPIFKSGKRWATLEVRFDKLGPDGLLAALWERPLVRVLALVSGLGFFVYLIFMRRTLRHLDPSAVVPTRVQAALDVMTEGVLLVDQQERVVLVNSALAERLGREPSALLGVEASTLGWTSPESPALPPQLPWLEAIRDAKSSTGTPLCLEPEEGERRVFVVNASPVLDGWGRPKGAIVTCDDVTELEHKTEALEAALAELEKSRDEIRLQNEELQVLAKRDPLTGVANRRAFMEWMQAQFDKARSEGSQLSCVMADIDYFKRINDTHGHAAGDEVIRRLAELLSSEVRSSDSVCRYGGEEFCIGLPGAPAEVAMRVTARLREKAAAPGFARVPVTVSFGIASIRSGASTLAELLDQADKALYASKEAGRDRVTSWDDIAS